MPAVADEAALLQHQNALRTLYSGGPVGNNDAGTVLFGVVYRIPHISLRGGIQCRGGFIEDQHRRIFQQCPGDSDALALPTG